MVGIDMAGVVVPAQYFDNFFIFFARGLIVGTVSVGRKRLRKNT